MLQTVQYAVEQVHVFILINVHVFMVVVVPTVNTLSVMAFWNMKTGLYVVEDVDHANPSISVIAPLDIQEMIVNTLFVLEPIAQMQRCAMERDLVLVTINVIVLSVVIQGLNVRIINVTDSILRIQLFAQLTVLVQPQTIASVPTITQVCSANTPSAMVLALILH